MGTLPRGTDGGYREENNKVDGGKKFPNQDFGIALFSLAARFSEKRAKMSFLIK
jgi:hypothetical protein